MDTTVLFTKILDSACPSIESYDGYSEYRIDTYGSVDDALWFITARKTDGVWDIKNYTTG